MPRWDWNRVMTVKPEASLISATHVRTVTVTLGDKLAAVSRSEGVEPQHAPARSQQARRRKDPLAPAEDPQAGTDAGAKLRNTIAAHFRNRASMQGELALTVASLKLGVHTEV